MRLETHSDCPFPKNYTFFHAVSPHHFFSLSHFTPLCSSMVKLRFTGSKKSHFRGTRMLFYFPSVSLHESVNEFCDSARGIIRCCNKGRRNVNEPRFKRKRFLRLLFCKNKFVSNPRTLPLRPRGSWIDGYLSFFFREYFTSIRRNGRSNSSIVFVWWYVYLNGFDVFFSINYVLYRVR